MSRYGQLADQLQQQIESGVWRAGERIPSIRQSCKTHGLSPMTVLQAYQLLESRGLVLARPQSGYYVKAAASPQRISAPRQARYSGSVDINDLVFEVLQASKSRELVPLGMAVADPALFPHPQLGRALGSCMRRLDPFSTVADLPPATRRCAGPSPAATRTTAWRWIPKRSSSPPAPWRRSPSACRC